MACPRLMDMLAQIQTFFVAEPSAHLQTIEQD